MLGRDLGERHEGAGPSIGKQDIERAALLLHPLKQPIEIVGIGDRFCNRTHIFAERGQCRVQFILSPAEDAEERPFFVEALCRRQPDACAAPR